MNCLISIVIPCFNHGEYIVDAVNSIQIEKYRDIFEIIVVNDGSTDLYTVSKLKELSGKGVNVIHQENEGLASARNKGIEHSRGKFILPLDSDNRIVPEVFIEAAQIMENDLDIDMIYTDAKYFGERKGNWIIGSFDGIKLLIFNYIDACALIRKKTLVELGYYDKNMPAMGNEDWDLWINFFLNSRKIVYLPKIGFHYRVTNNSMSVTTTRYNFDRNRNYIYEKYIELISKSLKDVYFNFQEVKNEMESLQKYIKNNKLKTILKIIVGRKII